jgi:CheY-like chemotaxis protein
MDLVEKPPATVRTVTRPDTNDPPSGRAPRPLRVLVVENALVSRAALSLVLRLDEGFEAEVVYDACSCLECLRASAERADTPAFDVLLLEVLQGAGQLGTEVLAAAQADPDLDLPPVIVCTALLGAYLTSHAPEVAASNTRVVFKPFAIDTLTAALHAAAHGGRAR